MRALAAIAAAEVPPSEGAIAAGEMPPRRTRGTSGGTTGWYRAGGAAQELIQRGHKTSVPPSPPVTRSPSPHQPTGDADGRADSTEDVEAGLGEDEQASETPSVGRLMRGVCGRGCEACTTGRRCDARASLAARARTSTGGSVFIVCVRASLVATRRGLGRQGCTGETRGVQGVPGGRNSGVQGRGRLGCLRLLICWRTCTVRERKREVSFHGTTADSTITHRE